MGVEIERKFLVKGDFKSSAFKKYVIKQGYLSKNENNTVRIRVREDEAFITIKSKTNEGGFSRGEWEYSIPNAEAEEILKLSIDEVISKNRYLVKCGDHTFEVDEFVGNNEGLIMAEIELKNEDENFEKPDWLGEEVTGDYRYYNSYLSKYPFITWNK